MSGVIKFRIWDKVYKKFRYGLRFVSLALGDKSSGLCINPEDLILQQFTGLKDKNGCEIYEGDIFKSKNAILDRYKIIFHLGQFCAQSLFNKTISLLYSQTVSRPPTDGGGIVSINHTFKEMEIVGNIFENPELIK